MGLLDSGSWHGKIYSNGWVDGSGGDHPVTEPATEIGRASCRERVCYAV